MFVDHWSPQLHQEWTQHRQQYSFFVSPHAAQLPKAVAEVREAIRQPWLPPIPDDELHITLLSICAVEKISAAELHALDLAAAEALADFAPFHVTLAAPEVNTEGVAVALTECDQLMELRAGLHRLAEAHLGDSRLLADRFFSPHLGLAYANAPGPQAPVAAALAPWHGKGLGGMQIDAVDLVTLERNNQHYVTSLLSRYPLAQ